jgi:tRNA-splicing ligase RtcB (3'-phosphate/5'-hydroxy nucleic acid ligase)
MTYEQLKLSAPAPILSWAGHPLGSEETQMAKNVASLPFVFKHVALMPDVHLGKGALVGSVIATKDAIIPAAVGVDIGCFTGETLIPVADGKAYPIAQLSAIGKPVYVYSCTPDGRIVASLAIARRTRSSAPLVRVVLDNGEAIECTPDHPFMLREGRYQPAAQLQPGTSLMPFYSKTDQEGYTLIQQNYSGRWHKAHWLMARSGLLGEIPRFSGQRTVIHHRNFDRADNLPANLQFMGDRDHSTYHRSLVERKEIANPLYPCETRRQSVKSPIGLHNHHKYQHGYNHKVVAVMPLSKREDVYCLAVPQYNNFALKAGVFVHNCGMIAVKTSFNAAQLEGKLKKIRNEIEASIPVGFNENKDIEKAATNWQGWQDFKDLHRGVQDLEGKALRQVGSLGGGNHFIELCLDTENSVWMMLHSGSRNIGNILAQCHISTAKELLKLADQKLPDRDLAYFIVGTPAFTAYWHDLQWAQSYARFNRNVMMARFKRIVEKHLAGGKPTKPLLSVNCHHNYAEKEVHYGEQVYVTRKGAVRAREEDYGIIPGSMGAKSFIVKGKGNVESYCSCSHGAGRKMSRTKAKREFSLDDLLEQTQGIECRKDEGVLDEIPGAYKSIDEVMNQQLDLVEIVATLKQVLCVKG